MPDRQQIKERAARHQHDTTDFDLARMLRQVRDEKTHRDWGFRSFKSYVAEELGWARARAYHLLHILEEFERLGLSTQKIDEIGSVLGWAKLLDLLPVLTAENLDRLIWDAMTMNHRQLRAHIKNLRLYFSAKQPADQAVTSPGMSPR